MEFVLSLILLTKLQCAIAVIVSQLKKQAEPDGLTGRASKAPEQDLITTVALEKRTRRVDNPYQFWDLKYCLI